MQSNLLTSHHDGPGSHHGPWKPTLSFFHSHSRSYTAWHTVLLQDWDVYTVQAQFITSRCVSRLSRLPNVCTSAHRLLQECTSSHWVYLLKVQEVVLSGLLLFDTMVINETQNQSFCQSISFYHLPSPRLCLLLRTWHLPGIFILSFNLALGMS